MSLPSSDRDRPTTSWPKPGPGFGVGLRRPHFEEIFDNHEGIDFLEVVSENFMEFGGRPQKVLQRAREMFPIIPHGVNMSIGGIDPLNETYLERLKKLIGQLRPPWFSDHLCYSSAFGVSYHDLIPLPFTEEAVDHLVERIKKVQGMMGIPFLLENISYYAVMPSEMTEAEFTIEVITRADCGLLLDVNNVYVNARNHGYDAHEFIDAMPAERVLQYHIAGHDASGPFLLDTHGEHIHKEVFDLYSYTLNRVGPVWTLLEWDNNIPTLEILLEENGKVRATSERTLAGKGVDRKGGRP